MIPVWIALTAGGLAAGCSDGNATTGPREAGTDSFVPVDPTYEGVEALFRRSCVFNACHGGSGAGAASLNFRTLLEQDEPITEAMVNVPACQYDLMPRIDPGDPHNSWLWIKLDPAYMDSEGYIVFTPDSSFDPDVQNPHYTSRNCPLGRNPDGSPDFGINMPSQPGHPSPLAPHELEAVRQWIAAGAPGPRPPDAGVDGGAADAATADAATEPDAATADAATEPDAATADAATEPDAATADAAIDPA
jgi:hypothetical protein